MRTKLAPTRRDLLMTCAAFGIAPWPALAKAIDITWDDLIPDGDAGTLLKELRPLGVVQHGELSTGFTQAEASGLTDAFEGQTVRLPGFIVPLSFDGTAVTTFILAPFVGACIHVPPPPANQLVLVETRDPYPFKGLFDPVRVTGTFGMAANQTSLAEIGYAIAADDIEPFEIE